MSKAESGMTNLKRLIDRYEHLRRQPILKSSRETLSWWEALQRASSKELLDKMDKAVAVAKTRLQIAEIPIIGVVGQLNAGKSSVVASLLSEAGRRRVPRGVESKYGTHRFVYWFPERCRQEQSLQEHIQQILLSAHEQWPEMLSEDSEQAFEQYRSGRDRPEKIPVPLVAYDPELIKFGFLDCMDIQTKDEPGSKAPSHELGARRNERLEFVARAARVCSAFFVVWERAQVRDRLLDELLGQLRQRMADVPMYLLVNKVRPSRPDPLRSILEDDPDVSTLKSKYQLNGVYVAMDYEVSGWEDYTPRGLWQGSADSEPRQTNGADSGKSTERFPMFYTAEPRHRDSQQDIKEYIQDISREYWLVELYRQLEPGQLQQQAARSHVQELQQLVKKSLDYLKDWQADCEKNTHEAYQGLLRFCRDLFADEKDEPKQIANQQFMSDLHEAIIRNAPWLVRAADWIGQKSRHAAETVKNRIIKGWIKLPGVEGLKEGWNKLWEKIFPSQPEQPPLPFKTAEKLAEELQYQRWIPKTCTRDELKELISEVLPNFHKWLELKTDPQELDRMAQDFWKNLEVWEKFKILGKSVVVVVGAAVGLAAGVTALVDGGATLLSTFSLTSWLATHIAGLEALTVAVIGTGLAFAVYYDGLVKYNTLPALTTLFYLFCDAFGLPRELCPDKPLRVTFGRGTQREFTLPKLEVPPLRQILPLPNTGIWNWEKEVVREWRELANERS
jgi:hypothetical protein